MTAAEQKLDQVCAHLGSKVDAGKPLTLQQVSDGAVALSLIEHHGHIGQAAEALGIGRDRIAALLAPTGRARQRRLAIGMVLPMFFICVLLCPVASAQPFPAAKLSLATVVAAPSNNLPALVTNRIEWPEFTNKFLYLGGAAGRTFLSTNGGSEFEIVLNTNPVKRLAAISNYTVLNGFTLVATTTNRFAMVAYPRNTRPAIRVLIQFTDGYMWDYGILVFPTNPAVALLTADVEGTTNLTTWQLRQRFTAFIPTTNRSESFRARLHLEPLATNAALVFKQNTLTLTNR